MSKKKVAVGVGTALVALASVVTFGLVKKNKSNKAKEVKEEE